MSSGTTPDLLNDDRMGRMLDILFASEVTEFFKDRLFFTGSTFLKRPERVMALVFQLFMWVRLVELEGRPLVLNLAPNHETVARLLGAGGYYLLGHTLFHWWPRMKESA